MSGVTIPARAEIAQATLWNGLLTGERDALPTREKRLYIELARELATRLGGAGLPPDRRSSHEQACVETQGADHAVRGRGRRNPAGAFAGDSFRGPHAAGIGR